MGALLCPQIVASSRIRNKYNDVALYLLTYHGVLASNTRDLFSAGSVAHVSDKTRGGIYIKRALAEIEDEMLDASLNMEDALFIEYWGESVPPAKRIENWLARADSFATDWMPSQDLFLARKR
jgi:hypothetical protein